MAGLPEAINARASKRSCSKRAERSRAIASSGDSPGRRVNFHLLLLPNLRFDDLNLFTRLERLSRATVNCVDDLGLGNLANFVGSVLLCLRACSRPAADDLLGRRTAFLRRLFLKPSEQPLSPEESMKLLVQNGTF